MVPGFGQSKMKSGASGGFEGLNRQNPGNLHGFGWGKVEATSHEGCSSPDFSRKENLSNLDFHCFPRSHVWPMILKPLF